MKILQANNLGHIAGSILRIGFTDKQDCYAEIIKCKWRCITYYKWNRFLFFIKSIRALRHWSSLEPHS